MTEIYVLFLLVLQSHLSGGTEESGNMDFFRGAFKRNMPEPEKRGPGSILTWALYSKQPSEKTERRSLFSPSTREAYVGFQRRRGKSGAAFVASMGKRNSSLKNYFKNVNYK